MKCAHRCGKKSFKERKILYNKKCVIQRKDSISREKLVYFIFFVYIVETDCTHGENQVKVVYYGEAMAVYAVNTEGEEFEFEEDLGEGVSWTLLLKLEKDSETDPSFDVS